MTGTDVRLARSGAGPLLWACAGTGGFALGFGVQLPTFPTYAANLPGSSPAVVGALVGAYSLAAIAGRLPFLLGRLRGRSTTLLALGAVLAAVATTVPVFTSGIGALFVMRIGSGLGDALFITTLFAAVIRGQGPSAQRQFAVVTTVLNMAFLLGPPLGEQIRIQYGYDWLWVASAALLASGCLAVGGLGASPPERGRSVPSRDTVRTLTVVFTPYLAFAIAPATVTTFGSIAMHEAGAANAAGLFVALSVATIAARLLVATGHILPRTPVAPFALAALATTLLAATSSSVVGLIVGSAILGVAQGFAIPACARQVIDHVPAGDQRAAMAVSTLVLEAGFLIAGPAFGPLANVAGLATVFAATAATCAAATWGAAVVRHQLHNHQPTEEDEHVGSR